MAMLEKLNEIIWAFRSKFSPIPEYEFNSEGEIVQNYAPIKWSRPALIVLVISGLVGAVIGVLIALVVNTALVEVSLSASFAIYFGILFIFVGLVVLWRTLATSNAPVHPDEALASRTPRKHLLMFACLNIITGVFCFLIEQDTLLLLSTFPRILVYSLLGMSASFALTFGAIDLLNVIVGYCTPESTRPLVESVLQIYVVVAASLGMGAIFGALFGALDVDSLNKITAISSIAALSASSKSGVMEASMVDLRICLPVGAMWGALAGLANEYIRRVEMSFNKLDQPIEFECDI